MSLAVKTISNNVGDPHDHLKIATPSSPENPREIIAPHVNGSGTSDAAINQWVSLADLMQVKCMTLEMAELLLASGIYSIHQLQNCIPENLHQRLAEINAKEKLLPHAPLYMQVMEMVVLAKWVAES